MSNALPQPPSPDGGSTTARGGQLDRYWLVAIPPRDRDRWPLRGRYVEMVWSELLGPTAVLVARRLGDLTDLNPTGVHFSVAAMSRSLGVPPSKVRYSLVRLARLGLVSAGTERGVLGVSGLAPPVGPELAVRLSEEAAREHRWWLSEAADGRPAGPRESVGLRRDRASRCGGGRSL